jgi:hypothetical protein
LIKTLKPYNVKLLSYALYSNARLCTAKRRPAAFSKAKQAKQGKGDRCLAVVFHFGVGLTHADH